MPSFSLLLFPLIGGFIFASRWYPTRFYALRADEYRLFFVSATVGAFFLFIISIVLGLALPYKWCWDFANFWHGLIPLEHSGKTLLAFLISTTIWLPLNFIADRFADRLSKEDIIN